ncbi:tetratricopeptide repeat protein [Sphingomonas crusticola]|uniref:tetratricopeptide repeat protein n=1 Tax=Sphingomonas crusticola TaxID=1697973 RepID=UPI000E276EF0|nr:tetratricopeptide repeat protein [Sphingomonas crusticola]
MPHIIPLQVWLLITLAAFGLLPARYVWRYLAHSGSARDLMRPPEALEWRSTRQFRVSLAILAGLAGLAVFIFTPAAARLGRQLTQSPLLVPILLGGVGGFALFEVWRGLTTGTIEPMSRGTLGPYQRATQPKRFWISLGWNAMFGALCLVMAVGSFRQRTGQEQDDQCFLRSGNAARAEALDACDALIAAREKAGGNPADLLEARGLIHYRTGTYHDALADFTRSIRLNPREPTTRYDRGLVYAQLGDDARAIADYSAAIGMGLHAMEVYVDRGEALARGRRFDAALADFSHAHALRPNDPRPLGDRAFVYVEQRDAIRAEQDLAALRAIDPYDAGLLNAEALRSIGEGDPKRALAQLTLALTHHPDDAWALDMRAQLYRYFRQPDKARADRDALARLTATPPAWGG